MTHREGSEILHPVNQFAHAMRDRYLHEVAALSEGCCPDCTARLVPSDTPRGPGGRCPAGCGSWWHGDTPGAWEGDHTVAWWAS